MKGRCDDAGIESEEWNGNRSSFGARRIFDTPESVVRKGFVRFMIYGDKEDGRWYRQDCGA